MVIREFSCRNCNLIHIPVQCRIEFDELLIQRALKGMSYLKIYRPEETDTAIMYSEYIHLAYETE